MKMHSPYIFIILTEGLRIQSLGKGMEPRSKRIAVEFKSESHFSPLIKSNASKFSREKAGLEQTTMKENMTLMEASVSKETSYKWSIDQVSVSPIKPFKQRFASAEQSMRYNR